MAESRFICHAMEAITVWCCGVQYKELGFISKKQRLQSCVFQYKQQSNSKCVSGHAATGIKACWWRWSRAIVLWELLINLQSNVLQGIGLWDQRQMTESKWISSGAKDVCSGITASVRSTNKAAKTTVSTVQGAGNSLPWPCLTRLWHMHQPQYREKGRQLDVVNPTDFSRDQMIFNNLVKESLVHCQYIAN